MSFKKQENFLNEGLLRFLNSFLSDSISADRKRCKTNHVLVLSTENWRKELDKNHFTGAAFKDLSKAFDCIPRDVLIANYTLMT